MKSTVFLYTQNQYTIFFTLGSSLALRGIAFLSGIVLTFETKTYICKKISIINSDNHSKYCTILFLNAL